MVKEKHLKGKGELLYDYKEDILTFKIKHRNYKRSVEFQNFVIDIDEENFVTGIRVFDASKIFGHEKYIIKNITHCSFNARIESNALTIQFKFISTIRNRLIPLIPSKTETFTHGLTTEVSSKYGLHDSFVECTAEV